MFKTLLPKSHGHAAFYVRVAPHFTFRIYKVKYLFSTVGCVFMVSLYVSSRHLRRLKRFAWGGKTAIHFDLGAEAGMQFLCSLKKTGFADVSPCFAPECRALHN